MKKFTAGWNRFWFEADFREQLVFFRTIFSVLLLSNCILRTSDLHAFYSENGLMPSELLPDIIAVDQLSLFHLFKSDLSIFSFHWIEMGALLALAFGLLPRLSSFLALVAQISFLKRNIAVAYGFDLISTCFLFYVFLTDLRKERLANAGWRKDLSSAAFRLMQIQICIIYLFAGFDKLQGPKWWNGTAIWDFFGNSAIARTDWSYVAHYPAFICFLTIATILWEVYFPVLVWFQKTRYWALFGGVCLHLGIMTVVHLPFFALLMIFSYTVFLPSSFVTRIRELLCKRGDLAERFVVAVTGFRHVE